jgi:peroxiredoxin
VDSNLALIVLVVLTFATALNLFLTFRLAALVRAGFAPPLSLPIGYPVPTFEGRRLADGSRIASTDLAGQAVVLVFLSPGCPACREKAAELVDILPGVQSAGLALWVIPADDVHDISKLVGGSPLLEHVLVLDAATRRTVNPRGSAPFYLFIDDKMVAKASNIVGDEDWRSFVEQMRDFIVREQVERH